MPESRPQDDANMLELEAAAVLAEALGPADMLHLPGAREQLRRQLEYVIGCAQSAIAAAENAGGAPDTITRARSTLLASHVARAQDARHGAGQLSRGSQRAPTREACDDGWRRVETIVITAETSAVEAMRLAVELDDDASRKAAHAAEGAARDARRIVNERNHAYTFHADPGFSFGEGWYLAAAAVLSGVAIQIEPNQPQTAQAERFIRDAGLSARLVSYQSRPRANKHLPEIVAQAFRADASSSQRALRAAFLGDATPPEPIIDWADQAMAAASAEKKVLLWVRRCRHHPGRNTSFEELFELARRALAVGLTPVLVGDAVPHDQIPPGTVDITLFWKEHLFQGTEMRRAQLQLFEHLKQAHGLVGQLGVTTAGMDGPALMGLPTLYLTDAPNVRMGAWVGAVPGYRELVRGEDYLDRASDRLRCWAADQGG